MIDFLIVGNGLAGISFAEIALQNNKSVFVFDNNSQPSSRVAGGLYNPVVLKRFSEVWKAKEQIDFAFPLYHNIQSKLDVVFDFEMPILRKLFSIEEQNNWFQAADKPNLAPFLDSKLVTNSYESIASPFHYGKVNHTGYLEISILIEAYSNYLKSLNSFSDDAFVYDEIHLGMQFHVEALSDKINFWISTARSDLEVANDKNIQSESTIKQLNPQLEPLSKATARQLYSRWLRSIVVN